MLEKLGGFLTICIAVTGLSLISVFKPPTWLQVVCALAGSFVCLLGVVFLFSEGPILPDFLARRRAEKLAKQSKQTAA